MTSKVVTMDDSAVTHTHTSAPKAIKSNVMSASMPLNFANDSRVKLVKGGTSSTIRKLIASEKGVTAGNNVNTVRKLKGTGGNSSDYVPPEGTKFFTFESYPSMKPEVDLYPNIVEQTPTSQFQTLDRDIQTDVFIERPESPAYIPAKIGVDTGTQIESSELFDFDQEVIPLLETLVAKTIEQAVFEVQSEEELKSINEHIENLNLQKQQEVIENIRREKEFVKDNAERQKNIDSIRKMKQVERELCTQVAATKMMKEMLPIIVEDAIMDLVDRGVLHDPTVSQVKNSAMTEISNSVTDTFKTYDTSSQLVDELIQTAQNKFEAIYDAEQTRLAKEKEETERLRLEEELKKQKEAEEKVRADIEAAEGGEEEVTEE